MANKNEPFGLRAIGKVGQNRDNQGLSEYSIANNYATTIYFQDAVKPVASGTIEQAAAETDYLDHLMVFSTQTQIQVSLRLLITMLKLQHLI